MNDFKKENFCFWSLCIYVFKFFKKHWTHLNLAFTLQFQYTREYFKLKGHTMPCIIVLMRHVTYFNIGLFPGFQMWAMIYIAFINEREIAYQKLNLIGWKNCGQNLVLWTTRVSINKKVSDKRRAINITRAIKWLVE